MQADLLARYDQRVPRYTSYPTAPHFGPAVDSDTYAGWLAALDATRPVSLYLHVPFCAELCLYCGCHTTVTRSYGPVQAYVEGVLAEIGLVAEQLPGRLPVTHIHWGGGTPSMLSAEDLMRITRTLRGRFAVATDAEIAIEIDPRTLTRLKVDALGLIGVTRASLGVQDFDPEVQRLVRRVQPFAQTRDAARWLREAGVTGINLDLMYGLPLQSADSVAETTRRALELEPDRIALFGYAHVPWMKKHQRLLPEQAMPGPAERLAQAEAAAAVLTEAGYVRIGLDHFARPGDPMARGAAEHALRRNFQGYTTDDADTLLGFGASSIGSLPQGYVQNAAAVPAWREAILAGRLPTARGIALSGDDRLRRDIIATLMCDLRVDVALVAARHAVPVETFAGELDRIDHMAADGIVERAGWEIRVPEDARPLLRSVASVFDRYLDAGAERHARAV